MIRFGILGAGRIAHTFAQAIQSTPGIMHAVASRDLKRAQSFQSRYPIAKAYGSYQKLYDDPEVDVIYVATPHGLHYTHMMAALDAKKHLLTEKAFTLNAREAQEVFDKAKTQNVFVMEAMWTRFLPVTQTLLKRVSDGIIGPMKSLKATFSFAGDLRESGRLMNAELGGGALLDVGIYPLTYADLFGRLSGAMTSQHTKSKTGVDLWNKIEIHAGDFQATLESGFLDDKPREAIITGAHGKIVVPSFWAAEEAFIYDARGVMIEHIHHPHRVNGFEYEIEAVIDALNHHLLEHPIMPHAKTIEMLEHMDAIRNEWGVVYPREKITS